MLDFGPFPLLGGGGRYIQNKKLYNALENYNFTKKFQPEGIYTLHKTHFCYYNCLVVEILP